MSRREPDQRLRGSFSRAFLAIEGWCKGQILSYERERPENQGMRGGSLSSSQDNCAHNEACWRTDGMLWTYGCPSCRRVGCGTTPKSAKEAFAEEENHRAVWVRSRLSGSLSNGGDRDMLDV